MYSHSMKILRCWKLHAKRLQRASAEEADAMLGTILYELIVCFSDSSELRPLQLRARACTLNQIWMQCAACASRVVNGELIQADKYMFAATLIDYCDSYEIADELLRAMQLPADYEAVGKSRKEAYMRFGHGLYELGLKQSHLRLKSKKMCRYKLHIEGDVSTRSANQYLDLSIEGKSVYISDRFGTWAIRAESEEHSLLFAFIPPDILEHLLVTGFTMFDTNNAILSDMLRTIGYAA